MIQHCSFYVCQLRTFALVTLSPPVHEDCEVQCFPGPALQTIETCSTSTNVILCH